MMSALDAAGGAFCLWFGWLMAKVDNGPRRGTLERQPASSRLGTWRLKDSRDIRRLYRNVRRVKRLGRH